MKTNNTKQIKLVLQMALLEGAIWQRTIIYPHKRKHKREYEYVYALDKIKDKVMQLGIGESLYFQPLKNNKSQGIVTRIK